MTESPPVAEQLPAVEPDAGNTVSFLFTAISPLEWQGRAFCKHGLVENRSYSVLGGTPPLNHARMVESVLGLHAALVGGDCPREPPKLNATVSFAAATAIEPLQQRYIPQTAAVIEPPNKKNFFFGPWLSCSRAGAYQLVGKIQLAKAVSAGARGLGVVVVQGVPILSVPMVDEAGKATANINTTINLLPNQSVALGYENTSTANQDVALCQLQVFEVWVP